jgi:hypothetical protein
MVIDYSPFSAEVETGFNNTFVKNDKNLKIRSRGGGWCVPALEGEGVV